MVNGALLVHILEVMTSDILNKNLSLLMLEVGNLLELMMKIDVLAVNSINRDMKKKARTDFKPLTTSMSVSGPDTILKAIGTEHVRHFMRFLFPVETYRH